MNTIYLWLLPLCAYFFTVGVFLGFLINENPRPRSFGLTLVIMIMALVWPLTFAWSLRRRKKAKDALSKMAVELDE